MTWWCSATGTAWTWEWRPYPGVWILVLLMAALWFRYGRVAGARGVGRYFALGLAMLWLATDWPLGALGAGYLASVHTVQFLLITLLAAPLLLIGIRPAVGAATNVPPIVRFVARPWVGLIGFNLVLFLTHVPQVVDGFMPTQLGSFFVDMLWLGSGLLLWWPIIAPDGIVRIGGPLQLLYLFIATIPPTIPAAFLTFADYPIYGLYELAPRVAGISAADDQQVAGLLMKAIGDPIIWIAMAIVFFRWHAAEERATRAGTTLPAALKRTTV